LDATQSLEVVFFVRGISVLGHVPYGTPLGYVFQGPPQWRHVPPTLPDPPGWLGAWDAPSTHHPDLVHVDIKEFGRIPDGGGHLGRPKHRAHDFFADSGITVRRVLTDNGSCCRSRAFADAHRLGHAWPRVAPVAQRRHASA